MCAELCGAEFRWSCTTGMCNSSLPAKMEDRGGQSLEAPWPGVNNGEQETLSQTNRRS